MLSRRWVRPSWFARALLVVGVAFFCWLGFWQIGRAHDKELLLAAFAGAANRQPVTLDEARRTTAVQVHPRVRVRGTFDPVHRYVLDDQVREGRQGVMVYDVFDPVDHSESVLVNRGFLARSAGTGVPSIEAPASGEQELIGVYAPAPGSGLRLGGNPLPKQAQWPKLTIYIDLAEIAQDLGRTVGDGVLLLDADPTSAFVREWTPQVLPPERHLGYAFQWFAFALAAIVIFIVLHWRRPKPGSP